MNIAGADGSTKGWSVAYWNDHSEIILFSCTSIWEIFQRIPNLEILAIDMIIGLPETIHPGGREAEKEARKLLSPRGSVVFSAPCRDAIYAENYPQALEISRASSPQKIGLSKQSYLIGTKIREVDLFLQKNLHHSCTIKETHPELSFWEMNGKRSLPSKHKKEGRSLRIELLQQNNCYIYQANSEDDLDALACLWSAMRIKEKRACSIPRKAPLDRFQLPMQITW